jgi:hypothetical protein
MTINTLAYHPELLVRLTREGNFISGRVSVPVAGRRFLSDLY